MDCPAISWCCYDYYCCFHYYHSYCYCCCWCSCYRKGYFLVISTLVFVLIIIFTHAWRGNAGVRFLYH
ncbi:hypothetical protein BDW42DRAFT_167084 [Aspergillus taichungensis]|uniref:Uncharacterized protein n=1 Tax=Aspergillus taichungensis TaxID=482145 RepID=A0A2J5HY25_9EURO|nr:hypothetical protein BDW42DRAFT_167084 [Aspergillus taichungensis]